ncbi:CHASE2 domain-containing protein [Methyloglobulus sp.]|uniref:CHASE2 domain-containing protein n=1 Tax=Methyloglobulus sp. TaxID=2518622 RepID=UPI0032B750B2
MVINNKRYSTLIWGAIIIALMWEAHIFSIFHSLNGFAYDHAMRLNIKNSTSDQLIVLDGDQQFAERGDETWLPLLKNVLAQDVKQVVFNFLPEKVSGDFYQFAADSGKVVFGQHVQNSDPYSTAKLRPLPLAAKNKKIPLSAVSPAFSQSAIYRTQSLNISIDSLSLPTLEYAAAQRASGKSITLKSPDYLINFIGGSARIPKINLAQALSGSLVSELVSGRTVLIGVYGTEPLASYFTPLSTATEQTSDVLFHAFALDTLLSERTIRIVPNWAMLLGIMAITAMTLIFCQYLAFQHSLWVAVVLTICYGLTSWLVLHGFFLWIPPVELVVAQWLAISLAWCNRVAQESQLLHDMQASLSANLQDKAFPVSFFQSDDPWTQLLTMINQSLNLTRIIFLERVPNDHRLREIKAFNCRINDVVEARRDYERTPYSTVIQANRPLLQAQPYLRELAIGDLQFLAPLVFADEVLGFWAFSVEPRIFLEAKAKFMALTHAYMIQISEFLFYRQEWQSYQAQQEKNKFLRYLQFNSGAKPYHTLNQSISLLERRATELQGVFNTLNTGGILYDLFGRVVLLNKYMEDLAQSVNLKPYNMTPLDLVVALTGLKTDEARQILQKTIFNLEATTTPVPQFKSDHDFLLLIQPLTFEDSKNNLSDSAPTPQIVGILIELEDVTYLKAIYRLKEQVFERLGFQIYQELASIQSDLTDCSGEVGVLKQECTSSIASVQDRIKALLATLESVSKEINKEVESVTSDLGCYPIDGLPAIKKAVAELNDYAILRMILLHLELPDALGLVFASPNELYRIFQTLLTMIIDDTFEGAQVWISVEDKAEWVHYHFRNIGIGISYKTQQNKGQNETSISAENLAIDRAFDYVRRWGGKLDISNQVGKGSTVTLSLRRFL